MAASSAVRARLPWLAFGAGAASWALTASGFGRGVRATGPDSVQAVRPFVRDGAFVESIRSPTTARAISRPHMKIVHGRASVDLANEIGATRDVCMYVHAHYWLPAVLLVDVGWPRVCGSTGCVVGLAPDLLPPPLDTSVLSRRSICLQLQMHTCALCARARDGLYSARSVS
jgi:hypothetical protein